MEGLATADRATQCTDTTTVDADTGTLRDVLDDGAGGGVDGVQAVTGFDQYTGAELAGRRTPAMIGVGSDSLKVDTAS